MERSIDVGLHTIRHTAESAAAQHATAEIFNHYRDKAEGEYLAIRNLLKPYTTKAVKEAIGNGQLVRDEWEKVFGALDAPETQEEINKFIKSVEEDVKDARRQREPEKPAREYIRW